jgi:hypothetical protein
MQSFQVAQHSNQHLAANSKHNRCYRRGDRSSVSVACCSRGCFSRWPVLQPHGSHHGCFSRRSVLHHKISSVAATYGGSVSRFLSKVNHPWSRGFYTRVQNCMSIWPWRCEDESWREKLVRLISKWFDYSGRMAGSSATHTIQSFTTGV